MRRPPETRLPSRAHGVRFLRAHGTTHPESRNVDRASRQQLRSFDVGGRPTVGQLDPSLAERPDGKLSVVDPGFPCSSHVDDLSHVLIGESETDLRGKLLKAGRLVGAETKTLQLDLSEKSTLLPDNPNTRAVVKILFEEGVQLETGKICDDVGVQMTGNGNRRASTLNKRIEVSGANRAKRTRDLI